MVLIKDTGARAAIPPFTDEHAELRESVSRFVSNEIAPHVDAWEAAREFPRELYERCGELGFLGLKYPTELGGQGGDYVHDAVWTEALAYSGAGGGVAAGLGAHTGIATPPVFKFGTPDQHQRFLVPAIRGEAIGALGITEPGAGSDVAAIRTFARKVDGGYVVNGSKTFITNGVRADFLVCAVKTTEQGGHRGISFLLLEREMPGYEVVSKLEKMGWHASDTGELSFTDVEVPAENLLGEEDGGFYLIMANFQWERLLMALGAVGAMKRLLEVAVAYASEREAFGRPIGRFQAIRHKIAELSIKAEVGQAMTYNALRLFCAGHDAIKEVTQAKLFTQRAAVEVADEVIQIHGGYGYMTEYGVERAYRDARLGPIGGGTDEVMKEILSKQLGL
ncbi:MAG: acyl-CoA dehydrogenase family protein [Actinomycetota bacterium]|nr:acyl-CoA dehydrogenase family protein [Actinomycetota bacterium]